MGSFLDELWDETLAGPPPEKGVSRLRKYKSLSAVRSPITGTTHRYHDEDVDQTVGVSRSITIIRPKNLSVEPPPTPSGGGSAASSPCTPFSPFSPVETGKDPNGKRFSRRKPKPRQVDEPTSPTVYDWIMISALDR